MTKLAVLRLTLLLFFIFTTSVSLAGNNSPLAVKKPSPQCVIKCGFQGTCRTCEGGGTKKYCNTLSCGMCITSGGCSGGGVIEEGGENIEVGNLQSKPKEPMRLRPALIREIAIKHPRFAATLASTNVFGFHPGTYEVYWTPTPLSPKDVNAFLDRKGHARFFKKYDDEARRMNERILKGEISEIVYSVTVTQKNANDWSIKVRVENPGSGITIDPALSQLDIELSFDSRGTAAPPVRSSWQIN